MGTPEFAVPSLELLVQKNKNVVAVVTAEDKPQGRGQKLGVSPVKEAALRHGIKVLQPGKLKDSGFIEQLKELKADLQVVVAFRMLPEMVWSMPSKGTFNLHASLLPQYRGAAPINWAIINGEKKTGVTTFFLQHEIDTGAIILQEEEEINDEDDAGNLYERLMLKGAQLVLKTVEKIERNDIKTSAQPTNEELIAAPKIFKETCQIDWRREAGEIKNFVRGLSPYPGAWTNVGGKQCKIFRIGLFQGESNLSIGEFKTDQKSFVHVGCKDGTISLVDFQLEGKRKMNISDFFRGNKIQI
jgi:methionyl-tRNA formyltransferase